MIIKQLSVFLENKPGRSLEVAQRLAENNINIMAFSIADGSDFGILRLIVSDVKKSTVVLTESGFAVMLTDVCSLNCPNETGSLAKILTKLADNNISVDYMYAFQYEGISQAILHAKEMDRCVAVLSEYEKI